MGSLMAGWNSLVIDPDRRKLMQRSKSMTKEEIDAYWKVKKQIEEEHLKDISPSVAAETDHQSQVSDADTSVEVPEADANILELLQKNGWWISSNWAFLNEPPKTPTAAGRVVGNYVSQFDVAGGSGLSSRS